MIYQRLTALTLALFLSSTNFCWGVVPSEVITSEDSSDRLAFLPLSTASLEHYYDASLGVSDAPASMLLPSIDLDHPFVVIVYDRHFNPSAQRHTVQILNQLMTTQKLPYVYLEAATGDVSVRFFRDFADLGQIQKTADRYLEQGLLHSTEYSNLLSDKDFSLWGVENQKLYEYSVLVYRELLQVRAQALKHLDEVGAIIYQLVDEAMQASPFDINEVMKAEAAVKELKNSLQNVSVIEDNTILSQNIEQFYNSRISSVVNRAIKLKREAGQMNSDIDEFVLTSAFAEMNRLVEEYRTVIRQRDIEMAHRMLEKMHEAKQSVAVLIVGEDHVGAIQDILKEEGVSFAALKPLAQLPTDFDKYEKLMMEQTLSIASLHSLREEMGYRGSRAAPIQTTMLRPMVAQAPFDLQVGKTPFLKNFAQELSPQALEVVNNSIEKIGAIGDPKQVEMTFEKVSWVTQVQKTLSEIADNSVYITRARDLGQALRQVDLQSDYSRYVAFKKHTDELSVILRNEGEPDYDRGLIREEIRSSITGYQTSLKSSVQASKIEWVATLMKAREALANREALLNGYGWDTLFAILYSNPQMRRVVNKIFGKDVTSNRPMPIVDERLLSQERFAQLETFLATNLSETDMPYSYWTPPGYWDAPHHDMPDAIDSILERQLVAYSLSIYDGATWQIALSLIDPHKYQELINKQTQRLLEGKAGKVDEIRAWQPPYLYGDQKLQMPRENAFFFRIISDQYLQPDPKDGRLWFPKFPNMDLLHHEDWKPITGEQAWAAIIGPLQVAYLRYGGRVPLDSPEMKLALDILPAIEAMASPIGAIYHAPEGTHGKDSRDISNENNLSMLAAMKMMKVVLTQNGGAPSLLSKIDWIIQGQEQYFKNFSLDKQNRVFYQGGYYIDAEFIPTEIFAVDCQTWGITVLGPEFIDKTFGEGMAYEIWQNTKKLAGYYDSLGVIRGVGFTDNINILSVEWTAGAIWATQLMADYYKDTHPEWAMELLQDAMYMREGIDQFTMDLPNGGMAYLYASKRFFIPFGWWANPLPSLVSSAWVVMLDKGYNPFVLGGGSYAAAQKPVPHFSSQETDVTSKNHILKRIHQYEKEREIRIQEEREAQTTASADVPKSGFVEKMKLWFGGDQGVGGNSQSVFGDPSNQQPPNQPLSSSERQEAVDMLDQILDEVENESTEQVSSLESDSASLVRIIQHRYSDSEILSYLDILQKAVYYFFKDKGDFYSQELPGERGYFKQAIYSLFDMDYAFEKAIRQLDEIYGVRDEAPVTSQPSAQTSPVIQVSPSHAEVLVEEKTVEDKKAMSPAPSVVQKVNDEGENKLSQETWASQVSHDQAPLKPLVAPDTFVQQQMVFEKVYWPIDNNLWYIDLENYKELQLVVTPTQSDYQDLVLRMLVTGKGNKQFETEVRLPASHVKAGETYYAHAVSIDQILPELDNSQGVESIVIQNSDTSRAQLPFEFKLVVRS